MVIVLPFSKCPKIKNKKKTVRSVVGIGKYNPAFGESPEMAIGKLITL